MKHIIQQLLLAFGVIFIFSIGGSTSAFAASGLGTSTSPSAFGNVYEGMMLADRMSPTKIKPNSQASFDIILKPQNSDGYFQKAMDVNDPTKTDFKNYLTPDQIKQNYGQTADVINGWTSLLKENHLTTHVYNNGLVIYVSGKAKYVDKLFKTNLNTATYHNDPVQFGESKPNISSNLKDAVLAIVGMADHNKKFFFPDTDVSFDDNVPLIPDKPTASAYGNTSTFAKNYDVDSLYNQGLTGKGQTVGIISFGNVTTSDLTHFWKHENANDSKSRFNMVKVKGNVYKGGLDTGSDSEATMDAEYAGSVAPQANINMYYAGSPIPTLINLLNDYLTAYDDNNVTSLSSSWGIGPNNYFQILEKMNLIPSQYIQVLNLVLAQAALQGISNFVAAGDNGALNYTIVGVSGKNVMMDRSISDVDPYVSSPWVTSAGGTTAAFRKHVLVNDKVVGTIEATKERSWGTDYYWSFLRSYPNYLLNMPENWNDILGGGGGGFGHAYQTPSYQEGVPGVNTFNAREYLSQLSQPVYDSTLIHGTDTGRNYPDISANADMTTGYLTYQKSSGWNVSGGTSIVTPQFAGVAALINSKSGNSRMGFWNPQLYQLATKDNSPLHPLNDTENNSNLYYTGQPNTVYNQASGLGTVDFGKLLDVYK